MTTRVVISAPAFNDAVKVSYLIAFNFDVRHDVVVSREVVDRSGVEENRLYRAGGRCSARRTNPAVTIIQAPIIPRM